MKNSFPDSPEMQDLARDVIAGDLRDDAQMREDAMDKE